MSEEKAKELLKAAKAHYLPKCDIAPNRFIAPATVMRNIDQALAELEQPEPTEKSCWNCNHRWVCKKCGTARKYVDAEWGGIHYREIAEQMAKLVGTFCPKYQALKEQ